MCNVIYANVEWRVSYNYNHFENLKPNIPTYNRGMSMTLYEFDGPENRTGLLNSLKGSLRAYPGIL